MAEIVARRLRPTYRAVAQARTGHLNFGDPRVRLSLRIGHIDIGDPGVRLPLLPQINAVTPPNSVNKPTTKGSESPDGEHDCVLVLAWFTRLALLSRFMIISHTNIPILMLLHTP